MVGGFNTNVRYRGRTFHVQTEDSGPNVAKIVTLLYEGGSILFSRKTAYRGDAAGSNPAALYLDGLEQNGSPPAGNTTVNDFFQDIRPQSAVPGRHLQSMPFSSGRAWVPGKPRVSPAAVLVSTK